jgi:NADH:ubiquinone oxidoreductase subunit 6 (subunit J)
MTPVLAGRWQTRTFLMWTVGAFVTLIFGALYDNFVTPFALLFYVWLIGMVSDVLFNVIQKRRWEHDWTPLQHVLSGIYEGAVIWLLTRVIALPGVAADLTFAQFLAHYVTVFVAIFIAMWGLMKILFPNWRFNGGLIVRSRSL